MKKFAVPFCYLGPLCLSFITLALTGCPKTLPPVDSLRAPEGAYDVEIRRDEWGVPHIYGKRDADVAFGLAYAHCEDDLETMQEVMLLSKGKLATQMRFEGLKFDFIAAAFRTRKFVDEGYEKELGPEIRVVCEAYAAGINHYAALHPDEVTAPQAFPAEGKDIIAGAMIKVPFFYGMDKDLLPLLGVKNNDLEESTSNNVAEAEGMDTLFASRLPKGSNSFAVAPSRSADGATRLDINSHQPWEGPVSWYEARLHSEEGWDIVGGVFPGVPVILHGHTANLGWAHTVNEPDLADVYALTINPDNPNQYMFDGKWRDFEVETHTLELRLWGNIFIKVPQEFRWSVHGPAFTNSEGTFAIAFAGYNDLKLIEQIYRMNKAADLASFQEAFKMRALPSMNTTYADKTGNIWYLYNANLPERADGYDWRGTVPGDTSATLWKGIIPFERMPQVLNPPCGWIQSCNNTPYMTTEDPYNPKREDYSDNYGIENSIMRNRSWRIRELLSADDSITRDEFETYKFDWNYSAQSQIPQLIEEVLAQYPTGNADYDKALEILKEWDLSCDPDNTHTAIGVGTILPTLAAQLFHQKEPETWASFTNAVQLLTKNFGRVDVPWSTVNLMYRGKERIGLGGGPDTLYAVYGRPQPDGTLKGEAGDSYILMPEWDKDGKLMSRSLHQYGSATKDEQSPHFADQAKLFQKRELKPVWFTEEELKAHTKLEYRPGDFQGKWWEQVGK